MPELFTSSNLSKLAHLKHAKKMSVLRPLSTDNNVLSEYNIIRFKDMHNLYDMFRYSSSQHKSLFDILKEVEDSIKHDNIPAVLYSVSYNDNVDCYFRYVRHEVDQNCRIFWYEYAFSTS
jgi:hypothetical protein